MSFFSQNTFPFTSQNHARTKLSAYLFRSRDDLWPLEKLPLGTLKAKYSKHILSLGLTETKRAHSNLTTLVTN